MPFIRPLADHTTPTKPRTIGAVAQEIRADWSATKSGVNFAAKPYLNELLYMRDRNSMCGCESAKEVALYFLSNATSYRTPKAAALKKELKALCGIK